MPKMFGWGGRPRAKVVTVSERDYAHMQTRYQLRAWFSTAPGSCFLSHELEQMARVLPNLFGFYLLQVGLLGDSDLVAASRVLNRQVLDVDGQAGADGGVSVRGSAGALPVASDSVDVVVLPHLLEFAANPHEALREVERVLVPEGHVVVSGFNPWSLMGLWRMAGRRRRGAPWNGHFLSLTRIKDWLALLGFDIVDSETFFFRVPFRNERIIDRSRFMDSLGKRFWPYLGGGYVIVARKRVVTLTPIKSPWRPERKLVTARWVEPTTRKRHGHCGR